MPTIVVATPKGGAGKSTTSLILGLTLAERGAKVTLIDADDNAPLTTWANGVPRKVRVIGGITDQNFVSILDRESATQDAVIIDLEGVASRIMSRAILRADLVLIPTQASPLDAKEAAKAVALVRQEEEVARRAIPLRITLTRTSEAVPTRATKALVREMAERGVPSLRTQLNERVPFKSVFEYKCALTELDPKKVNGIEPAIRNANAFTDELVDVIKSVVAGRAAA